MNNMKKFALTLSTIGALTAPVAAVISCGNEKAKKAQAPTAKPQEDAKAKEQLNTKLSAMRRVKNSATALQTSFEIKKPELTAFFTTNHMTSDLKETNDISAELASTIGKIDAKIKAADIKDLDTTSFTRSVRNYSSRIAILDAHKATKLADLETARIEAEKQREELAKQHQTEAATQAAIDAHNQNLINTVVNQLKDGIKSLNDMKAAIRFNDLVKYFTDNNMADALKKANDLSKDMNAVIDEINKGIEANKLDALNALQTKYSTAVIGSYWTKLMAIKKLKDDAEAAKASAQTETTAQATRISKYTEYMVVYNNINTKLNDLKTHFSTIKLDAELERDYHEQWNVFNRLVLKANEDKFIDADDLNTIKVFEEEFNVVYPQLTARLAEVKTPERVINFNGGFAPALSENIDLNQSLSDQYMNIYNNIKDKFDNLESNLESIESIVNSSSELVKNIQDWKDSFNKNVKQALEADGIININDLKIMQGFEGMFNTAYLEMITKLAELNKPEGLMTGFVMNKDVEELVAKRNHLIEQIKAWSSIKPEIAKQTLDMDERAFKNIKLWESNAKEKLEAHIKLLTMAFESISSELNSFRIQNTEVEYDIPPKYTDEQLEYMASTEFVSLMSQRETVMGYIKEWGYLDRNIESDALEAYNNFNPAQTPLGLWVHVNELSEFYQGLINKYNELKADEALAKTQIENGKRLSTRISQENELSSKLDKIQDEMKIFGGLIENDLYNEIFTLSGKVKSYLDELKAREGWVISNDVYNGLISELDEAIERKDEYQQYVDSFSVVDVEHSTEYVTEIYDKEPIQTINVGGTIQQFSAWNHVGSDVIRLPHLEEVDTLEDARKALEVMKNLQKTFFEDNGITLSSIPNGRGIMNFISFTEIGIRIWHNGIYVVPKESDVSKGKLYVNKMIREYNILINRIPQNQIDQIFG